MDRENKHDALYASDSVSSRHRKLITKFQVKPYGEEFKSLYILALVTGVIFQILSLVTAVTLPASWVHAVFHNWGIGFLIAGVILILLEALKRILVSKAFKNFFQFKKKGLLWFAALPSIASIAFSVLGTPILIREFGAQPTLADTSLVSTHFDAKIADQVAYWDKKANAAKKNADQIHSENNWKGVTVRGAQDDVLLQREKASALSDSSVVHKTRLENEKASAISAVLKANVDALQKDKDGKQHAGMMLGGVTLLFELLFILALAWCERYDFKEALYLDSLQKVNGENQGNSQQKGTDSQPKSDKSGQSHTGGSGQSDGRTKIGFLVSEGTVKTNRHGTKVIAYEKEKGGVKWYREGQLTSQITEAEKKASEQLDKGNQKSSDTYKARADRLKGLKRTLTNHSG